MRPTPKANGKRRPDWPLIAGMAAFLVVGLGFMAFGAHQIVTTRAFLADATPVEGEVIAQHESCDDDGCTWRPTFRFTDARGEMREAQTLYGASNYGWSEGTERIILHNPGHDHVRIPGFWNLWLLGGAFFALGALPVAIALYVGWALLLRPILRMRT